MVADMVLQDYVNKAVVRRANPQKMLEIIPDILLAIESAETPEEISGIRSMTRVFQSYLKETLPSVIADRNEIFKHVHKTGVLMIESSAKAGKIWQENKTPHGGDRRSETFQDDNRQLDKLNWFQAGFKHEKDAQRCVRASEVDEAERWQYYEECRVNAKEPTMNGIEKVWHDFFKIDTLNSSESNEWYTPIQYIEAALRVLGTIDIDPASNEYAQQVIKAKVYYTSETNGLDKDWIGKCWLNPPYGDLCPQFVARLLNQYTSGNVTEAILLVNSHAVETNWFAPLWNYLLCFTDHRINFVSLEKEKNGSTHGSVFIYLGMNEIAFYDAFKPFGYVVKQVRYEHSQP